LSPTYFSRDWCRREWRTFLDHDAGRAWPGEPIVPACAVEIPGFFGADGAGDPWKTDLARRQTVDLTRWRTLDGLPCADVRELLKGMEGRIHQRIEKTRRVHQSASTIPQHNRNFAGRDAEMRRIRQTLALGRVGAITAVHGLGGIGKTALAFEYAHRHA